jgi:triacylglycerol esterase/lipase EstA (alpha/beta hydrolase family)
MSRQCLRASAFGGALFVAVAAVVLATAAPALAVTGINNFPAALTASLLTPDAAPPGANDYSCAPSAAHPRPIVLVHGTYENAFANWNALSAALKNAGYCVFAGNFGGSTGNPVKGTGAIPASAAQVATFVDGVLAATGAAQVDLVGHSQGGGVLPRWYLKFNGGANAANPALNKVHSLIGLAPSNHGTTLLGLGTLATELQILGLVSAVGGQAATDQLVGSTVNTTLDAGGDTMPGVSYTTIVTRYDEVVTPYTQQYLTAGTGATVTNITLQNLCILDLSDHLGISYDPIAIRLVLNALDPASAVSPTCVLVPPVFA